MTHRALPNSIWKSFLEKEFDFYGVDNCCFCIGNNGARVVLEATEDSADDYRSYFDCFLVSELNKNFFSHPIAKVKIVMGGESTRTYTGDIADAEHAKRKRLENFSGWTLVDVLTGHVWLTIGTDHGEDYYPCFVFRYTPDKSKKVVEG